MNIKTILTAVLPLAMSVTTLAQEARSPSAMPFLSINPDPVSMAMGGTLRHGAFAHFSALARAHVEDGTFAAGASYSLFQPEVTKSNVAALGVVYNLDSKFAVTFGFLGNFGQRYDVTTESGYLIGDYMPFDLRAGAGLSWKILDRLSAGLALNYVQSAPTPEIKGVKDVQRTAFADIQVRYQLTDAIGVALSGTGLGIPVEDASGKSFSLPSRAILSADGRWQFQDHSLRAAAEAGMYCSPATLVCGTGVEYGYLARYFVRVGGHWCGDEVALPGFVSAGFGVRFGGLDADLAWNYSDGPMNNSLCAGLSYKF